MKTEINIPNFLSMLRILLIPVLVLFIIHSNAQNYPVLIGLFALSVLLDFLDGFLARKLSQETEFGKVLDPLADKLLFFFIILALTVKSDFPIWLAILVFSRDLVILLASVLMYKRKHTVAPSNLIGKITFGVFGLLILVYIIDLHESVNLEILKNFFTLFSFSFLVWSGVEYYNIFVRYRRKQNAK
ncbi:MAG: CDP-alcohol phosphatidyltransferase family protein [Candidatus Aminicenantes bacterium]|nr:CDP-alcohol phosphatidyltransferase family protein [Candidatus Aminicenantes bacterium]